MKKFLFIIVLILGVVNFREHSLLKPYTSKVINLVSTQAKSTAGVIDSPTVFNHLKELESIISPHEYNFVISNIGEMDQVNDFYQTQCHDVELSHIVLTHYSIKRVCEILSKNLN